MLFEQGITGIVGPNGCGKSNVVDAIRWVLGEQKTKKLRSEKMEEVIFNGTQKKKKASFCEVSMTFENTRNILPTEYTTVTITRKLFRDGESEYLLNNIPCRLKDITNLFMDTGIGPDSYAIIELGMVKDILNDKDHSRKQLFEEAAGVAKYKVRKLATFRKLEETQGHLSRVEDLLFEIDGNLKTLEKQAKKAERYLDLRSNYRHQSSQLAYLKIRHLNDAYENIEAQEQKFQEEIMGIQASIDLQDAKILEIQKEIVDQEIKLSTSQKDLNQHTEFIQKVESEKSIRNERLKYLQQREYSIGQQLQQEKTQLESSEKFQIHSRTELEAQKAILQLAENEFIEQKAIFEKAQADRLLKQKIQDEMLEALKVQEGNLSQLIREKEIRQIRIESLTTEVSRNEQEKASRIQELDAFSEKLISLQSLTEQLAFDTEALLNKKQETESQQQQLSDKSIQLKD
ncbi:MAG: chromosome segregation protein SMC, partial [Sphingobacteriia bacterium]|nr:chromosome segregation protein SMC [Sphingobacteriia bacterium]